MERWRVSVDYGTANPASFGLWGLKSGVWYRVAEYYYSSRREGRQKTDAEYVEDLRQLADGRRIEQVVVDPSAASFITALRQAGFPVTKADNEVLDGIRVTADLLKNRRLVICSICADCLREMELYCWESQGNRESPRKENDHAMLVSGDVMLNLLKLTEFQNPLTGLNFQGTGTLTTPLGATLLRTSAMPEMADVSAHGSAGSLETEAAENETAFSYPAGSWTAEPARELSRVFERDARRYDGGFSLY